jgi:DNA-directed RNA polymerase subunit RPC12/RpoP
MEELEDEITCPYCGSNCITDYEPEYNEDDDIDPDWEYTYHCTACGKHFNE